MVKIIVVACFVLLLAIPALAQDDFPRIQTSMGYANLSFPNLTTGVNGHQSGFSNETSFNLTKTYGVSNYMGIYSVGQGSTLIADFIGGKVMYRGPRVVPYATAGFGFARYSSSSVGYYNSSMATRYGAGVDIPMGDILAIKVEYSRMNFHVNFGFDPTNTGSWTGSNNISAGVVFTLVQ